MKNHQHPTALLLPVLRTKIIPVFISAETQVKRVALIDRMYAAREQRLIVLNAPAGYGKSILLAQYRQHLLASEHRVAWLSCDEMDNDPFRMLDYLSAAIEDSIEGFSYSMHTPVGRDAHAIGLAIDAFAGALRNVTDELYIFLDDIHRVEVSGAEALLRQLVEQLPATVHILTSSRSALYTQSQDLALTPAAFVFDAEDLRFTADECSEYLQEIKQLQLTQADVEMLHRRSEGWVTALHLLALALSGQPDRAVYLQSLSGCDRNIADYLQADVDARLPAEVLQFLQQTSVLDEFNAELCDVLTGRDNSLKMLAYLQRNQLFISAADGDSGWFRYHTFFAEYQQALLLKNEEVVPLQRAAASWCEAQGLYVKAIKYSLRARDFAHGAKLLELHGGRLVSSREIYGLLQVIKQLPGEQITEHAVFQIFYAWQLALEQRYSQAEALIEDLSLRLPLGQGSTLHYGLAELMVAAQVLKALVLLYQDKLESCIKVARHWLHLVSETQPIFSASLLCIQAGAQTLMGDVDEGRKSITLARYHLGQSDSQYLQVVTSLIEALICKEIGMLLHGRKIAEAARVRVEQVYGLDSRIAEPLMLVCADILYEQNQHQKILHLLPKATRWRDVATPVELLSRGKLVMARAHFFSGDVDKGLLVLDDWLDGLHAPGYERVFALGMSCKVQFLLWLRRPNEAERTALQLQRHMSGVADGRLSEVQTARVLTDARLALAERRADKAQVVLENCIAKHLADQQRERRLHLSLLLAVAYWRKGNVDKAFALYSNTLEDAWACGYRRMFLDDALWLYPLMDAWIAAEPSRSDQWQAVAQEWREQCKVLNMDPDTVEDNQDVSRREREILRFVAAGLSNRDIAQAVHLSEATIKWHLHNLFTKLSVRSRTQAVLKGKSLGLLSEA